jgi:hypothetical protein
VLVGFVGYGIWNRDESVPPFVPEQLPLADEPSTAGQLAPPIEAALIDRRTLPEGVRPGSMRATLLESEESGRGHLLRLAIVDEGYDCEDVVSAAAVGDTAQVWRARCTGGDTYWVTVDELDRLVVEPAPYGDIDPAIPGTAPVDPAPQDQIRLDLRERR